MSAYYEFCSAAKHFFLSKRRHGVHSPFVYTLMDEYLLQHHPEIEAIELQRRELLKNNTPIQRTDFGAGSRRIQGEKSTISRTVRFASSSKKEALAIANYCKYVQAKHILELGTNVGICTAYLAKVNPDATIYSIEGDPLLADQARELLTSLHCNAEVITGTFEEKLPLLLEHSSPIDVAIIDGNHRYSPTMNYIEQILPHLSENGSIIIDDIYWSKEMTEAWIDICQIDSFNLAMDFMKFGIVKKSQRKEREYFRLRL